MNNFSIQDKLNDMGNNDFLNAMIHLGKLFLDGYSLKGKQHIELNEEDIIFIINNKTN